MPHLIASGKTGSGRILRATTICWLVCLVVLAGCKEDGAEVVPPTRVKVVTTLGDVRELSPAVNPGTQTARLPCFDPLRSQAMVRANPEAERTSMAVLPKTHRRIVAA